MNAWGKVSLLGLSLALGLTMSACGNGSEANKDNTNASGGSGAAANTTGASDGSAGNAKQTDNSESANAEKFPVSYLAGEWGTVPKSNGPGVDAINEKFNIDFKPQIVPMGEAGQKVAVVMASGDAPDILDLEGADGNFVKWAKQGAFLPLNDYIDKYPELKLIPQSIWNAVTVDGKIYGIPKFFRTKYMNSAIIRKDWLDKLNLQMPTTYAELLKVAEAFTTQDPDGNKKNDTYGFSTSKGIDWDMRMGNYYNASSWLKDDQGGYMPGIITDGAKERVQFLTDAYKEGLVPKDWPVMDYDKASKLFYQGKAGIYYEGIPGNNAYWDLLQQSAPDAVVAPIPPFLAPDGSQGQPGLSGYYQLFALSGKLKDEPAKIDRILSMINYFMQFIPVEERNPNNADFDWKNGGVDKGYKYADGEATFPSDDTMKSYRPASYFHGVEWAPSDEDLHLETGLINPIQKSYVKATIAEWSKPNYVYIDPTFSIYSEKYNLKFWELYTKIADEETKIILGQTPMSDWDKIVQDYLKAGGQDMIDEVNAKIKEVGVEGTWK
ncbi:extracellular solute-binding protein [Paenibacillus lycopersici]|uniref:Extracellular solute-binding protein n=1 Tax=Paenibacillus lycopersici TaxID=2704462 RepID=A0A6C0G3T3_9BACL|nr:extracellular solute-binding protein [Paenibacillus lycopersici]QHT61360.1 extracellular solute-binding protein [Paenibacillus lycopersici]